MTLSLVPMATSNKTRTEEVRILCFWNAYLCVCVREATCWQHTPLHHHPSVVALEWQWAGASALSSSLLPSLQHRWDV